MSDLLRHLATQFADASLLDRANFVLGVIGVWLMIRRRLAAFPVGLVAVSVQGVLFYRQTYFADALLQVFFFVTLAWGWRLWMRDRGEAPELPVTRIPSQLQRWMPFPESCSRPAPPSHAGRRKTPMPHGTGVSSVSCTRPWSL